MASSSEEAKKIGPLPKGGPGADLTARQGGKRAEEGHESANSRIMVKAGLTSHAISDAPGMQLIMEWLIVRNALRVDPKRPGRDQGHLRLSETARSAVVADQRLGALVGEDLSRAALLAMFELGQKVGRGDANAGWVMTARAPADLPETAGCRRQSTRNCHRSNRGAGASQDAKKADWLYRTGYYYQAKSKGLLKETVLK